MEKFSVGQKFKKDRQELELQTSEVSLFRAGLAAAEHKKILGWIGVMRHIGQRSCRGVTAEIHGQG